MRNGSLYIMVKDKGGKVDAKKVFGHIDEVREVGYYKDVNSCNWCATDIKSGYLIASPAKTLKEAVENVNKNMKKIEEIRKGDEYFKKVETLNSYIEKFEKEAS